MKKLNPTANTIEAKHAESVKRHPPGEAWVLGAGISGQAAANLLTRRGWKVYILDEAPEPDSGSTNFVQTMPGVQVIWNGRLPAGQTAPDLAVLSPGISTKSALRTSVAATGCRVISELDLGAGYLSPSTSILAVTGSKGKSSLVKLLADSLRAAGIEARPAGNYGTALCELAGDMPAPAWAIVECSSFQLAASQEFHPRIAILLNLSPDHLDWHGSLEAYRDAKLRIFERQGADDLALVPAENFDSSIFAQHFCSQNETFGLHQNADWRYFEGTVTHSKRPDLALPLHGCYFDNQILGSAAAAAAAALAHIGLPQKAIQSGFQGFVPLPHRMQFIAEIDGVRYVNDSKATSLTALLAAVRMSRNGIRLIAGGRLKETIWLSGKDLLTSGVKKVYLVGESAMEFVSAWKADLPTEICGTLDSAVSLAAREAGRGDTVLLSPGAASFDQFNNYQERGAAFITRVEKLGEIEAP